MDQIFIQVQKLSWQWPKWFPSSIINNLKQFNKSLQLSRVFGRGGEGRRGIHLSQVVPSFFLLYNLPYKLFIFWRFGYVSYFLNLQYIWFIFLATFLFLWLFEDVSSFLISSRVVRFNMKNTFLEFSWRKNKLRGEDVRPG